MKLVCLLLTLGIGAIAPGSAKAQVSIYADFSATRLTDLTAPRTLYGPTVGAVIGLKTAPRLSLGVDFRGTFVSSNGVKLDSVLAGPHLATHIKRLKPYGEFMIGFARYNDGLGTPSSATTDSEVQLNAGVDFPVAKHFDWRVVDYSWAKYLALGGEFNPRTYSTGLVFRLP